MCKMRFHSWKTKTLSFCYNNAIHKTCQRRDKPTISNSCEFYRVPSSFAAVFIGSQGSGKSATANSFLGGGKYFKSRSGTIQCTTECASKQIQTSEDFKSTVHVIDTPPLNKVEDFDNIKRYVASRKFTAVQYIIVIKTGRFSKDELSMFVSLGEEYASDIERKSIVIFSNAAELEVCENNQGSITLEMYVGESKRLQHFLTSFVQEYFGIDNINWNSERKARSVQRVLQSCGFLMDSQKSCIDKTENLGSNTPCDNTKQSLPSPCDNTEQSLPSPCDNTEQSLPSLCDNTGQSLSSSCDNTEQSLPSQVNSDLTTDADETESFEIVNPEECKESEG